jgi:hypothetical protein
MNLLYENLCRPCVLSCSTSPEDTLNYGPIGLMAKSPLTDRPRDNSHELIYPNHPSSPEFIYHISHHSLISPSYTHQNSLKFPQVSDRLVLTFHHKQRRNNYRLYDIINFHHLLACCNYSMANLGHSVTSRNPLAVNVNILESPALK